MRARQPRSYLSLHTQINPADYYAVVQNAPMTTKPPGNRNHTKSLLLDVPSWLLRLLSPYNLLPVANVVLERSKLPPQFRNVYRHFLPGPAEDVGHEEDEPLDVRIDGVLGIDADLFQLGVSRPAAAGDLLQHQTLVLRYSFK